MSSPALSAPATQAAAVSDVTTGNKSPTITYNAGVYTVIIPVHSIRTVQTDSNSPSKLSLLLATNWSAFKRIRELGDALSDSIHTTASERAVRTVITDAKKPQAVFTELNARCIDGGVSAIATALQTVYLETAKNLLSGTWSKKQFPLYKEEYKPYIGPGWIQRSVAGSESPFFFTFDAGSGKCITGSDATDDKDADTTDVKGSATANVEGSDSPA